MESYAAGETTPPLLEETIGESFTRTATTYAEREALVEVATGRRWTWAELDRDVDAVARGLMAAGLEPGDRVGMWAPNCAEWTIVQFATAKAGIVLVNVNPAYRTHELAYAVEQSGMRLLLATSSYRGSDYRAMVEQVRGDCPALERAVYVDTDDWADLVAAGEAVAPRPSPSGRRGCVPTTPSTSSTPAARRATPRARRSATATSSTTASWSPRRST